MACALLASCGGTDETNDLPMAENMRDATMLPYARDVVSFEPGPGSGYGKDRFPDVVLGPPVVKAENVPSLDVLSLGAGGSIVLSFGERVLVDGPGPDLVVFENVFFAAGDPSDPFAEVGEVAVSADGRTWQSFVCEEVEDGRWSGCAGWTRTELFDPFALPLDPGVAGGDAFDLADVGLSEARYVRITDLSVEGEGPTAGVDLDAVGLVHYGETSR